MHKTAQLIPTVVTLWIVFAFYLARPKLHIRKNQTFPCLVAMQALQAALLLGIGGTSCEALPMLPPRLCYVAALLCHALACATAYLYYLFLSDILHLRAKEVSTRSKAASLVLLLSELVVFSGFFTGMLVRPENGQYLSGPLSWISSACFLFYTVASFLLYRKANQRVSGLDRLCIVTALLLLLAGTPLFRGVSGVPMFGTTCLSATLILFLAFENPVRYIDWRGGAFNIPAFRESLDDRIGRKPFRLLAFAIQEYEELREMYGISQMDQGIVMISRFLCSSYTDCQVFYLRNGRFALLGSETMDWERIRQELTERFKSPWLANETELDLSVVFIQTDSESIPDSSGRFLDSLYLAFDNADGEDYPQGSLVELAGRAELDRQVEIKHALDRCLERNEVEIFLQPLVDSTTCELAGAEVLCRIRDGAGNLIPPSSFIPIAEKYGCITLLGEQVFEKACRFVRDSDMEAIGLSWINVNLSPLQCIRSDLSQRFLTILEQYGIPIEFIHLEITEQTIQDIARLEKQVRTLRSQGFFFSLDDYGSGFSNLGRVKHYPFNNIKLDMQIVWDYIRDRDVLLPTIVHAFKQMGFSITAEGIESKEIADAMRDIGCDYLQGYYFSKPLPADEFVEKYTRLKAAKRA